MAHIICGIDLGAFSVKLCFLEVGFRTTTLRGLIETAVPASEAPLLERQASAVREGLSQAREATSYLALPGDQLSVRLMQLPFTDARKVDQVVGYELEGQIVHALEDVVFDHLVVGQTAEGSSVLAVAAKRDDVAALIAAMEAQNTHPRAIYAGPVLYRALLPSAPEPEEEGAEAPAPHCHVVLDLGHARTNVCFVRNGETLYTRTLLRGGQQLTQAIAKAFEADLERAEQAKRNEAALLPAGTPAPTPLAGKLDAVLREAIGPLVRELRQTFASFRATARAEIDGLLVTGGTGRLRGLLPFLEAELGLPARFLAVRPALAGEAEHAADRHAYVMDPTTDESESHALAAAVALAASRGSKEIDFRRGPFVYRASFSFIRQRAWHLARLAAVVALAFAFDVGVKLSSLGDDKIHLDKQLKTATQELLGQPRSDAKAVTELVKKGFREDLAPLPKATAFDLLDQISRRVPPADKVKLDILELEIRPKKTFIKGTVDTAAAVDDMAGKLKEIDCFEEVSKGAITEVSGGKQFTLNITSKCP
jgi:general secretion pathway protein L